MRTCFLSPLFAVLAVLTLASTPTVQGEEAAAKPLKVGSFSFSVGAPWKESDTPGPMSQGTIETPGKDGAAGLKASFYHFGPGQGGALSGNIERWQGMFQSSPAVKTEKEEMEFGKEKATLVTLSGTYVGSRFSPEKNHGSSTRCWRRCCRVKRGMCIFDWWVRVLGWRRLAKTLKRCC